MIRRKITTAGNSAALVLSQDVLGLMGVGVGDEVDISLVDRTLVVRPIAERGRDERVAAAVNDVFRRRRKLLQRLAEGAPEARPSGAASRRRRQS